MNTPNWLQDINGSISGTPFGDIDFHVKRHKNQTAIIETTSYTKLKYVENTAVFADIERLLNNLIDNGYTGKLQFEVIYEAGNITRLTIKNKQITNYRDKK